MKNIFIGLLALFLISSLSAQIQYTDYGDGMVVPRNADESLDINGDGVVDFYINKPQNNLAFTPNSFLACIAGTGGYTSWGTKEMRLFNEGDLIHLEGNGGLPADLYMEEGTMSVINVAITDGLADGWIDKEDHYIGFAILNTGILDGWMKVSVDIEEETLTIKEIAYVESEYFGEIGGGIHVGETGLTSSVSQIEEDLNNVLVSPNPARDFTNIRFDYTGTENLSVSVQNNIGQEIHRIKSVNLSSNFDINTSAWSQGTYFIRFETKDEFYMKKLSVVK